MNCDEAEILLHGLLDQEIDAEPKCRIEAHVGACARCATQLRLHRAMRAMMSSANLRFAAPPGLRTRVKELLPLSAAGVSCRRALFKGFRLGSALSAAVGTSYRRPMFRGFAFGSALSAAAASLLMIAVIRSNQDQVIVSDVVSAHLRSLQANHLTDVQTGDRRGVKPWFSARVKTMQGFNVALWSEKGLNLCAVGDVSAEELEDLRKKFEAATWSNPI
jgi:anti-sigma factor RsiW